MSVSISAYIESEMQCWWCGKTTRVFTWPGHELWSDSCPEQGRPPTIKLTLREPRYWANHCEHCGRLQGDWFVYCEPQDSGGFVFGDQSEDD
jgi:hypothetical protein